jgi:hypothetical protein
MEEKCSHKNHKDIKAMGYCSDCNIYLCNKCFNVHTDYLEGHKLINLSNKAAKDLIFSGICLEENHGQKFEYYCKNHNKLCCASCICKIEGKGKGQHKNCDVVNIEEVSNQKKSKLSENIKYLEKSAVTIESKIEELNKSFEEMNRKKEILHFNIAQVFTKIRQIINEREDEILASFEKMFDNSNFKDENLKKNKKFTKDIQTYLEKGKTLLNGWNNDKDLPSKINGCIDIENIVEKVQNVYNITKANTFSDEKIIFLPQENDSEFNKLVKSIQKFGKIQKISPYNFKQGNNYTLSENGKVAQKTKGGNNWNCFIIGDKEIPQNKITKWNIKLKNFKIMNNTWNVLVGIGPKYKNEENFHRKCWSFVCGEKTLCIKGQEKNYNNHSKGRLNEGDVIEVVVDRVRGNLSFLVNEEDYGVADEKIPVNDELYPVVCINDENQMVEIL